jgi:hypothetical protein
MKKSWVLAGIAGVTASVLVLQMGVAWAAALAPGNNAFGFNAPLISGFPGRSAAMTGGGAYNLPDFVHSGGGFSCLSDIAAGPFAGCLTGQGVRWDTAQLLRSTTLKCTGAAAEPLKTATTGDKTVVLLADFYRQGDGNDESFTAQMVVSDFDIAPDIPGIQNVWIQGIGCGTAIAVSFN